ncbi:hypothetical protein EV182_000116 [Spiromyces aspiralis]|uniref:Uncharacterized protein n=1 Tax=Spiromyces aspiralis TaxID=68401 RepID=A0ACC1HYG2_9FUNG|nr:hypothetical protein EV182_000116 [Spiromyces aspiralis]
MAANTCVYVSEQLSYEIHSVSSYSPGYPPREITVDSPKDQSSRWMSATNNRHQYITLVLDRPAFVRSILFGKHFKPHACNLKEFKVYGGMSPDCMVELLHAGLQNDSEPETFLLRQQLARVYIPCRYIKIQPILTHEQKFQFSIWYVELHGTTNPDIVARITEAFSAAQHRELIRSCLRYFRENNLLDSFRAVQRQTGISLEAPIVTGLYDAFVVLNSIDRTEHLLVQAEKDGLFDEYAQSMVAAPLWRHIASPHSAREPCGRGGHQMCIDDECGKIYIHGGWDGHWDLDDLWEFDIESRAWRCLSANTLEVGGPGPVSCHCMCFDSNQGRIYTMGRLVELDCRANTCLDNHLYCYDIAANRWYIASAKTERRGGPRLMFDAQMVYDPFHHCLYVYGGKVIVPNPTDAGGLFGGLYRYDIAQDRWIVLRPDADIRVHDFQLRGRIFTSMAIDPHAQRLYIFSDQCDKNTLGNMFIYDIATDSFYERPKELMKIIYPYGGRSASDFPPFGAKRATLCVRCCYCPVSSLNSCHDAYNDQSVDDPSAKSNSEARSQRIAFDPIRREIHLLTAFRSPRAHVVGGGGASTASRCRPSPNSAAGTSSNGTRSHLFLPGKGGRERYFLPAYSTASTNGRGSNGDDQALGRCWCRCHAWASKASDYDAASPLDSRSNGGRGVTSSDERLGSAITMAVLTYRLQEEVWDEVYNSSKASATLAVQSNSSQDGGALMMSCDIKSLARSGLHHSSEYHADSLATAATAATAARRKQPMRASKAKMLRQPYQELASQKHYDSGTVAEGGMATSDLDGGANEDLANLDERRDSAWSDCYSVTSNQQHRHSHHCASALRSAQEHTDAQFSDIRPGIPEARYAQNWVYSSRYQCCFMFGGNPMHTHGSVSPRLNDLWILQLRRPGPKKVLQRALFLVREQRFLDICANDTQASNAWDGLSRSTNRTIPSALECEQQHQQQGVKREMLALNYLQTKVAEVIDHSNPEEAGVFRSLTMALFKPWLQTKDFADNTDQQPHCQLPSAMALAVNPTTTAGINRNIDGVDGSNHDDDSTCGSARIAHEHSTDHGRTNRARVFNQISGFFPAHLRQPASRIEAVATNLLLL